MNEAKRSERTKYMISVMQAKMKLPVDFIQNLYRDFNEKTADKILLGMQEERYTTLRVNTLKTGINYVKNVLDNLNIEYETVEFYNDALIIKEANEKDLMKLDLYKNGEIYLQSLSSMIPVLVLSPSKGENVLDLTAAPGSKTTQMAAMMENDGYILANEIDKIRCDRLKHNVELLGANIVQISNEDGINIGEKYREKFDKVLIDVPCSGEGRFLLNDSKTYSAWSNELVKNLSNLQKELFKSAYNALKKDGVMVYSTCTLNKEENEKVINWAIQNFKLEVLDINLKFIESTKASNKGVNKEIEKAIKILPSKRMEGFFVCKLKKND